MALAVLVAADPAWAYVRTRPRGRAVPVRWLSPEITMVLDTRDLPAGLTRLEVLAVLKRAAARWSHPSLGCTGLVIRVLDGSHVSAGGSEDGRNSIAFHRRAWCEAGVEGVSRCHDARVASLTTLRLEDTGGREVRIREADIELNAATFTFSVAESPATVSGTMDLETVVLHELGHVLGLAHVCGQSGARARFDHAGRPLPSCEQARSAGSASVMVPGADTIQSLPPPIRRTLSSDDVEAVCAVYPVPP